MSDLAVVGRPAVAVGSRAILTGQARYCSDLTFPNMLVGKLLYSQYPSALIKRLDVSLARSLPGVVAMLIHNDIPGENSYLYAESDQPILVSDTVRFQGDAIAAVAAENEEAAAAALEAIEVEYEPLPGIFDPVEAMKPGTRQVWSDRENVHAHLVIECGDIEDGFKQADIVIDNVYSTQLIEHAFLETECAIARVVELDGTIEVYSPGQAPHRDRMQIARALGIAESDVRVVMPYIGGAFGGKDEIHVQIHAALLAQATGRPVLVKRTREESIRTHVKRHPVQVRYRTGATRTGKIVAIRVEAIGDTGPYANAGAEVMSVLAATAYGPYRVSNARIETYTVLTNNPICGAMRGFGIPQGQFACERNMDELARALDIDPLELRLINGLQTGDRLPTGATVRQGDGMKGCLKEATRMATWEKRHQKKPEPEPHLRRGWGLASIIFTIGLGRNVPDFAGASLDMATDGSVILRTGATDYGQGAHTALAQIAAESLGVELAAIRVLRPDTDQATDAGPAVASRTTIVSGNAIMAAAKPIRQTLLEMAAKETGLPEDILSLRDGQLYAGGEKLSLTIADLASRASSENRSLHAEGFYAMEYPEDFPEDGYQYAHGSFTFATQVARVLVDLETGEVTVEELVAVQDAGQIVNPGGALGQVEGGCSMGVGYTLMEELLVDQGRTLNNSLESYLIPTSQDIPKMTVKILEYPEPFAPYGVKGIGESSLTPTPPALVNAVVDAIGVPIYSIPLTAENVLAAIESGHKDDDQ
jgi:CO/xanthine dehydrogenase Mo-binding subunit